MRVYGSHSVSLYSNGTNLSFNMILLDVARNHLRIKLLIIWLGIAAGFFASILVVYFKLYITYFYLLSDNVDKLQKWFQIYGFEIPLICNMSCYKRHRETVYQVNYEQTATILAHYVLKASQK